MINNQISINWAKQACYDYIDMQYLQKFSKERKNFHFLTQKRLQLLLSKQATNYQLDLDLLSIPSLFSILGEFNIENYSKTSLLGEETTQGPKVQLNETLEEDEFSYMFIRKIKECKFIKNLKFRINRRETSKEELNYFSFD